MEVNEQEFRRLTRMVEENNKLLHKMRRHALVGTVLRVAYFVVIVGAAISSYIFLQPFVEAGKENAQSLFESIQTLRGISDINLEGLFGSGQ